MGSKHNIAGWVAIVALVAGSFVFARSASEAMRLPLGDIEPLAVSPESTRLAAVREATETWAHELDRIVAGLQEQAVIERADARQARVLVLRARTLGYERDRAFARVRSLDRGPISAPAGRAELDRIAAWLRRSAEATPEASRDTVAKLGALDTSLPALRSAAALHGAIAAR